MPTAQKIELLSVRKEGANTFANVFVSDGQLVHFEKYVIAYLEEKKNKTGDPIDHRPSLNTMASIRAAELQALWTDDLDFLHADPATSFWWKVWLTARGAGQRQTVVADFKRFAELTGCVVNPVQVNFSY